MREGEDARYVVDLCVRVRAVPDVPVLLVREPALFQHRLQGGHRPPRIGLAVGRFVL